MVYRSCALKMCIRLTGSRFSRPGLESFYTGIAYSTCFLRLMSLVQGSILPNNVIFRQKMRSTVVLDSAVITLVSPLYFLYLTLRSGIALKLSI